MSKTNSPASPALQGRAGHPSPPALLVELLQAPRAGVHLLDFRRERWERGGAFSAPTHHTRVHDSPHPPGRGWFGVGIDHGKLPQLPRIRLSASSRDAQRERGRGEAKLCWRPRHTRAARLDRGGAFLLFVLSCASSLPSGRGSTQIPEP